MSKNKWKGTKMSTSPRLIHTWKDLKLLISNTLKDTKIDEDVIVLSDWPESLYQESHHSQNKPFVCFYSNDDTYFVSLDWVEPYGKQVQGVLWIQETNTEVKGMIKKMTFHMMDQVPPVEAMVHTGSHHMLIAYCGDMHLRLFGDQHQAFTSLGTVPCRFSISCLCYNAETEMLLSGTSGAVVTWFILPNGRGLQMAQTVPMPGQELVQGLSLNGPCGSLLALCENVVRVFTHEGQGLLKELKRFTLVASGHSITCSFTCVSQGTFYAGNKAGEIHAWGLDQGNFLHSFQAHSSSVICVHSRPETHTLLTAGQEGVLREWNLASGNLLRQLSIDEDLQRLQFIDNITFFCQTTSTFSVQQLPYFYSLFNVCGSAPQWLRRVCCGHNWTQILCATEDGLLRFLSPITGDLLIVTWPLLVMDKAVAWAYDSGRDELFVAIGSPEVLVFDATRSPCTAKYLVCTSENHRDKVSCLAYASMSYLGKSLKGLMFSGHESGILRILSQYNYARIQKTVHSGAVLALSTLEGEQENSLLCSYGRDNIIHLTEAVLQDRKVILQPVSKITCVYPLKHVILLPDLVGAITEKSCWCLWRYQDSLISELKQSSMSERTKRLHNCAITSFDVCFSLKIFVTGAIDGSVRIWDFCGKLVTELDSALNFGPLCFANNWGDLLLTFNQSIYIVSCLKLLPPTQLIHLSYLNNEDEIQEVPKPFLPSFLFSFETVFVPKFVYLGQELQELQGLETLVNKRVIAFDNTVPHVVEEEKRTSLVTHKTPKLLSLEVEGTDFSTFKPKHKRPYVPAQLQLVGWDGLNSYPVLQNFFGKQRQWPFAPDCYIPNSVIRACLWPEGTPVFLHCDLSSPYQDKDWDLTESLKPKTLSSVTLEEKVSRRKQADDLKEQKRTSFSVLESMSNQNWVGRKFSDGLVENLIETILNLTVYCSAEQYKKYFNFMAQIFATYQIPAKLRTETVCRLLKDTTHYNPHIRELAWEMLEKLGFMSHLFAIPLAMGLMDSNKNVRTKALHLMTRYTGIQTKTMLVHLLKNQETLQEMQLEMIGETSLGQLLGIQASDIQCLLSLMQQQLNENLTLSRKDKPFTFPFNIPKDDDLEFIAEQTFMPLPEPKKITELKKRKRHIRAKSRELIKKALIVARKHKRIEMKKISSVLVPSEDTDKQRETRKSGQSDTQDVALWPELPLSPDKSQDDAETKKAIGDLEVTEDTDQRSVKGDREVIPRLERQKHIRKLWRRTTKKAPKLIHRKRESKGASKGISEMTIEEPKDEVVQTPEPEEGTRQKHKEEVIRTSEPEEGTRQKPKTYEPEGTRKKPENSRGLAGAPGRVSRTDTRSWREDVCSLITPRIASSHPGMMRDLSKELVDLAWVMLADRKPSWDLFQEICPLLKKTFSPELDRKFKKPPILTEKVTKRTIKDKGTILLREQEDNDMLKEDAELSPKHKKVAFLDHLVLEQRKFKKAVRKVAKQKWEIVEEERKLEKSEKKSMQRKKKLSKNIKNQIYLNEKMAQEKEKHVPPQRKLTTGGQKLVLEEKRLTGKKSEAVGKRKKVIWKEVKPTLERRKWDSEEIVQAHQEGMGTEKERLLFPERSLAQERKEVDEEEEELTGRKEEQAWEEEALLRDTEGQAGEGKKQSHEKRKYSCAKEKPVEEEKEKARDQGTLARDHLPREEEEWSEEERKQAPRRESSEEQENKLAPKKKKWSVKGEKKAHKKRQTHEKKEHVREQDEQEKRDQEEKQEQKEKEEAKEKKHLARKREKLDLEKDEKFGEMKKLSQEDMYVLEKTRKAWRGERRAQKEEKTTEKKRPSWEQEIVDLEKERHAGDTKKQLQEREEEAKKKEKMTLEKKLTPIDSKLAKKERHHAKEEKAKASAGIEKIKRKKKITQEDKEIVKEEDKLSQEERKLAYDVRTKGRHVEKWGKITKEERIQATRKLDMERISSEEKEVSFRGKNIEKKKRQLLTVLVSIIKEMSSVPIEEMEINEEERTSIMGKGETDDHRQKFFQEQEEVTEEEMEQTKKERKLEGDRPVTKARTLNNKEGLEEDQRLLEEVQKKVLLDKIQVEAILRKIQENNLLGKRQLGELLKRVEESEPEKTQVKWILDSIRDKLLELASESWTEKETEEGLAKKRKDEASLEEGEEEEILPKEEKKRHLVKKKKKVRPREEKVEEIEPDKTQVKWILDGVKDKLLEVSSGSCTEKETEGLSKKGKDEASLEEGEEEEILPKEEKKRHLVKKKKKVSPREEKVEESEPEKTQVKWILDGVSDKFLEVSSRNWTEKETEGLVKKGKDEASLKEGEEEEILPKGKKKRHLVKKKISLKEEKLEESEPEKTQVKWILEVSSKSCTEKEREDGLSKKGKDEASLEEGEEEKILPKEEKKRHLVKKKKKKVSPREEKLEESEPEKTQVKWKLDGVREKLLEVSSENWTEEEKEDGLSKKGKDEESLEEGEEEEILPKEEKKRPLVKKKKVSLKEEESEPEKTQVKWILDSVRDKLLEVSPDSWTEKETEEGLSKKGKDEASLEEGEEEEILPKEVKKRHLVKKKEKVNVREEKLQESEPENIQVRWILDGVKDKLLEVSSESWTEEEREDSLCKKGKDEASLAEREDEELTTKKETRRHLVKIKKKASLQEEKLEESEPEKTQAKWILDGVRDKLLEVSPENWTEEERKEGLYKKGKDEARIEEREKEILAKKEKSRHLVKKKKLSLREEKLEDLVEEHREKSLAQKRKTAKRLTKVKERLSKTEGPDEGEMEHLLQEEWGHLSEEEEEQEQQEEESLSKEKESLSEEEESLSKEERSLREEEEESLSKEEEESLSEEEEESLSEEEGKSGLSEEERMLKSELSKEVGLSKPVIEGEGLATEREGTARRKMLSKKESLLHEKKDFRLVDKSPFKIPPVKVSEDHLDLKNQDSQVLRVSPITSKRRQEIMLLEKLKHMQTGLKTQIPEELCRPAFQLPDNIMKPQKSKRRPKGHKGKWSLAHWDFVMGKTVGQSPAPVPAPTSALKKPADSEARVSDGDWINNILMRLEAGEQLSRDSFYRLSQLLRDYTSKGYWDCIHLSNLKIIAKHLRQILDLSHTDISQPCKDVLSPIHLKVIPPIRRKEGESQPEPLYTPESVLASATNKIQTPWHLLAESYRKKQAQQLPLAVKDTKHLHPSRKDVPTAVYPSADKNSLASMFQKDLPPLRGRVELPTSSKAKKKAVSIPVLALPSTTKRITDPMAVNWHVLGEPYRSARIRQLSNAVKDMEMRHSYPAKRDILMRAHASVDKQTLALMFQKDLAAFKGKGKFPRLPKLEKTQPISRKKEKLPPWETFVALYHVLRMLQQRYAEDTAAWMEQFHQIVDLYQLKSPQIQRLLRELLLREEPQPHELIYNEALKAMELVPGERLLYCLICGGSHTPAGSLKFHDVIPLPGQNTVDTVQPIGIAQYGFLELAWKSLPQVKSLPH